ncbi:uncharacterized protein LOC118733236 [Rhagoletis pomonella]|uniref:uncharacterized protein LOC118733236 n=1 Tax=Rhagoletis pomonella TaxID=28610 RepID=UPI0017814B35|nr:uncharacterized protein LOC118733236 [Rhagoletis pomonella]
MTEITNNSPNMTMLMVPQFQPNMETFGENLNAFTLNQFIVGAKLKIYERLCEEDEKISCEDALRKAMILESKIAAKPESNNDYNVNFVKGRKTRNNVGSDSNNNYNKNQNSRNACGHCGWRNHKSGKCRFEKIKCHTCGKIGHLASICRMKVQLNYVSNALDANASHNYAKENNDVSDYSIFSITDKRPNIVYSLPVAIDGVEIRAACDTGAPCTLVSETFQCSTNLLTEVDSIEVEESIEVADNASITTAVASTVMEESKENSPFHSPNVLGEASTSSLNLQNTSNVYEEVEELQKEIKALKKENLLLRKLEKKHSAKCTATKISFKQKENKYIYKIQVLKRRLEKTAQECANMEEKLNGIFTSGQINKMKNADKRQYWDENDIAQSITLRAASAKAYKLLYRKGFPLPSIRTLQKWAQKIDVSRGLIEPVFKLLAASTQMDETQKLCVLSFDESKIKKSYCYDKSSDTILGPASYVQVAMLRGLCALVIKDKYFQKFHLFKFDISLEAAHFLRF